MVQTATFLERLKQQPFFRDQIAAVRTIPARPASLADPAGGLREPTRRALEKMGISRLYRHQAEALDHVRAGRDIVVVTGTASGKTLCYALPVMEKLQEDPQATALFLYPTKALAQDQLRGLQAFRQPDLGLAFLAGVYDGDTPQNLRRKLRDGAHLLLTNPDMLHQGILPQHARWNRFFSRLAFVVVDELHAYRGVFGSHLANVLRRLRRICRHYGAEPRFIGCSATIANPVEHAERLTGRPMTLVDRDGSPRGPRRIVLWNPPVIPGAAMGGSDWRIGGDRRSARGEAVELMTLLLSEGVQTIAFVRTRLAAELIFKDCRERLRRVSPRLAESIHAYRGGYLPEERRELERRLAARELLGVSSTNALELGIDIGSLDACILVGYPGSVASFWQRAGRAGRGRDEAVVFLVGQNAPMDQYLMAHRDYLFDRLPEHAVVDPDNPHILVGHLRCAAHELPLREDEVDGFGPYARAVLDLLVEEQTLRPHAGAWYWASTEYPAAGVSLRHLAGPVYTIQDETAAETVIGTMDEITALSQLHDHAVYLHGAETYLVRKLDLDKKIAVVEKKDLDYYTQSVSVSDIRVDRVEAEQALRGGLLGFGDVTVTTTIPMFKKIKFHSRDSLGFEKLELPPQSLETVALWFAPPEALAQAMLGKRLLVGEALTGLANVLVEVAPFLILCDPSDIGTVVDARNLGRDALFVHDRYPGGMGYARRCFEQFDELLATAASIVRDCACRDGCPSCVGAPLPPALLAEAGADTRGRVPDKAAARFLLDALLG